MLVNFSESSMYVRPTASVERNVDGDCVQCAVSWTRSERPGRRSLCPNGRRVPRTVFQMPFPSGRNTLLLLLFFFSFEVFVERQESNRAPTETARQAGRLLPGREEGGRREREGGAGGYDKHPKKKKKIPGISVRSWKDILNPATATNWTPALR